MKLAVLMLALCSCAAYQRAVERDLLVNGRCEIICDEWSKRVSGSGICAIKYIKKTDTCRCWQPLMPHEEEGNRPIIVEFPAPKLGDAL